jgi:cell division protein FtsB
MSFSEFVGRIDRDHRESRRRARRGLVVLVILLLVVLGYMNWLYSQIASIDAGALADFARGYTVTHLPEAKETLRAALIENAPAVTDQAQQALLRLPTLIRKQIQQALPGSSEALAKRFEEELDLQLGTAVAAIVRLSEEDDGKRIPRQERIPRLLDNARAVYHGMLLAILEKEYSSYAQEVSSLNTKLRRLQDGSWLSTNEQIQREIIEATLVLMERHNLKELVTPETIRSMGLAP